MRLRMSLTKDKAAELAENDPRFKRRKKGRVRGRKVYWAKEVAVNTDGNSCCVGGSRRSTCIELVAGLEKGAEGERNPTMVRKCRGFYVS